MTCVVDEFVDGCAVGFAVEAFWTRPFVGLNVKHVAQRPGLNTDAKEHYPSTCVQKSSRQCNCDVLPEFGIWVGHLPTTPRQISWIKERRLQSMSRMESMDAV